jgi:ATP-dependent Clp protease protease subunit
MKVVRDNEKVITEMAKLTAQPRDKLAEDLKRDFYLTAPEAAAYGLIDKVLVPDHVRVISIMACFYCYGV